MDNRDKEINQQLKALLSGSPRPLNSTRSENAPITSKEARKTNQSLDFSFIFFSDAHVGSGNKYELVFDLADFGDRNGFKAVWMPERHFHPFGGIYPNPAVLAAAIAVRTRNIRLRSGSVVLPLHHPTAVVESWAMVDNLSGGRVDMGFASGWNPNDFVAVPEHYEQRRELWHERIPMVQKLWRGEALALRNGKGEISQTRVYPQPIQDELNVWLVVTKSDESFRYAGEMGYNVLTMLQGIDLEELGRKIQLYTDARKANGFDPETGKVTLMLHTLVHSDRKRVEEAVREPFFQYIKSALTGHMEAMEKQRRPSEQELQKIVEYSYQRYFKTGALFGSIDDAAIVVDKAREQGVTEVACLMDFGVDYDLVRESLPYLNQLKNQANASASLSNQTV